MDDEPRRGHLPSTVPTAPDASAGRAEMVVCSLSPATTLPAEPSVSSAHSSHGLRDRATAGAASLGAAALLVLSFGPTALALTPSSTTSVPPQGRSWIAPLDVEATTTSTAPESRGGPAS